MSKKPRCDSFAVEDPEIEEVLDRSSGIIISARDAIGSDYDNAIKLRMALRTSLDRNEPTYLCPLCAIPVYLVCLPDRRRFFFRHELEDGRCPARTKGDRSEEEINARKYNGVKESVAHIRMKEIIAESLRCDRRFSDVSIEKVWRSQDQGTWRKPDVQAMFEGKRVAFEIQLSTTFLRVIAQRRDFYLQDGALLVWIFKHFDEEKSRLTQDDVFYNNNRNAFLASEETLHASRANGALTLECRWTKPVSEMENVPQGMEQRLVTFSELTLDLKQQRVFFFDYDQHARSATDAALRRQFEGFWLSLDSYQQYDEAVWWELCIQFGRRGFLLPKSPYSGDGPMYLLNALYSAKHGRPIGWRFKKLIQVAHCIQGGHKDCLHAFRLALIAYNRGAQIQSEDAKGKWRAKVKEYRPLMDVGAPEYSPNRQFDRMMKFLFPDIPNLGAH